MTDNALKKDRHYIYLLGKVDDFILELEKQNINKTFEIDGFCYKSFILQSKENKMRYFLTNIYNMMFYALSIRNVKGKEHIKSKMFFFYDHIHRLERFFETCINKEIFKENAYFIMRDIMCRGIYNPIEHISESEFYFIVNRDDDIINLPLYIFYSEAHYALFSAMLYYVINKDEIIIDSYLMKKHISSLIETNEIIYSFDLSQMKFENIMHLLFMIDGYYKLDILSRDQGLLKFRFRYGNNISAPYTVISDCYIYS